MSATGLPVTALLQKWRAGDEHALGELMPLVYDQLRGLAARYLRSERPGHTLRATAVVHEAYLRLIDIDLPFADRVHFYAVAGRLMRRILMDWARSHNRQKRGGGAVHVTTLDDPGGLPSGGDPETLLAIDPGALAARRIRSPQS